MSQENVELHYRCLDAFNRRDLDAFLALMDDDVEVVPRIGAVEGERTYRGHDGVRLWWNNLLDVFPDWNAEVVEMRDGQKRKSDRKFFPGYVLVQMEMDEGTWHLVKEVPKVLGFIGGTPEKPAPITDKEAMGILRRVEEGVDKPKPKVLFEPGEVVRVTHGPFNDFNGVVESVNYEKNRLQVAVQILGRSTPVELDFSQVEKA